MQYPHAVKDAGWEGYAAVLDPGAVQMQDSGGCGPFSI